MNARKILESPLLEIPVERLIITNDRCTASIAVLPDRDGQKLRCETIEACSGEALTRVSALMVMGLT
jgi:hypothetical protein